MREFADDPETTVHPQTVIEHFGSWNKAKRGPGSSRGGSRRGRSCSRLCGSSASELGRSPTAKSIESEPRPMPSKSLYWHTFGSLSNALREAGFDVAVGEERLERRDRPGRRRWPCALGRLPKFADWADGAARTTRPAHGVAGLPDVRGAPGRVGDVPVPVRERLLEEGGESAPDGSSVPAA